MKKGKLTLLMMLMLCAILTSCKNAQHSNNKKEPQNVIDTQTNTEPDIQPDIQPDTETNTEIDTQNDTENDTETDSQTNAGLGTTDGIQEMEYTCSNDNMFGLEKIYVYKDKVVAVFDKEKCDASAYGGIGNETYSFYPKSSVCMDNLSQYKTTQYTQELVDDKYVSTIMFEYQTENIVDTNKPIEVTGVDVYGREVDFNKGNIKLLYSFPGGDCIDETRQNYDQSTGKWDEVVKETKVFGMTTKP